MDFCFAFLVFCRWKFFTPFPSKKNVLLFLKRKRKIDAAPLLVLSNTRRNPV